MTKVSLQAYFRQTQRKNDPADPSDLSAAELAGMLSGYPAAIDTIAQHLASNPELWNLAPADMMRTLELLPGVGRGMAAWFVLNELQIAARLSEAN